MEGRKRKTELSAKRTKEGDANFRHGREKKRGVLLEKVSWEVITEASSFDKSLGICPMLEGGRFPIAS